MSIRRFAITLGVIGLFLAPGTAAAAAPSDQDSRYLRAAHQSNLAEIAGGEIARDKGRSQRVKDLGARFVADHTRLDDALTETAQDLGVSLPELPTAEQRALAERYRAASGDDFDALFVATQMDAHMAAMRLGRAELARGSDDRAQRVARNAAPVIAAHHDALRDAARDLGVPTSIGTGTGGQAAGRGIGAAAGGLIAAGVLLVTAAAFLLRRRAAAAGR
jgi:putative membrane protein